jgi:hypothetical protein
VYAEVEARFKETFDYMAMDVPAIRELDRTRRRVAKARFGACLARADAPGLLYGERGRFVEEPDGSGSGGYRVLVLPEGTHFFKGTRYFNDSLRAAGGAGAVLPFMWVGNAQTAAMYAQRYQGGLTAYRATRELRLFVLTRENCRRLHAATPWRRRRTRGSPEDPEEAAAAARYTAEGMAEADRADRPFYDPDAPFDPLSPFVRMAFETKFGVGITLGEQARRAAAFRDPSDPAMPIYRTRRVGRFTYCAHPERTRIFGTGANDRVVAAFFRATAGASGASGAAGATAGGPSIRIDGWFSPESFSPFHCGLSEELLLLPELGGVAVDAHHPLHWTNWFSSLAPLLPRLPAGPFELSAAFHGHNRAFRALRHVLAAEDAVAAGPKGPTGSTRVSKRSTRRSSGSPSSLRVLTYHANGLRTPNGLVDEPTAAARCAGMVVGARPDVAAIQAVPEEHVAALDALLRQGGLRVLAAVPCGAFEGSRMVVAVAAEVVAVTTEVIEWTHLPKEQQQQPSATLPRHSVVVTIGMGRSSRSRSSRSPVRVAFLDASGTAQYHTSMRTAVLPFPRFLEAIRSSTAARTEQLRDLLTRTDGADGVLDAVVGSFGWHRDWDCEERRVLTDAGFVSPPEVAGQGPSGFGPTTIEGWTEDHLVTRCTLSAKKIHTIPFSDGTHLPVIATLAVGEKVA